MAAPAPATDFLTQEGPSLWRASKLLGVTVYGPENKRDGDITDVLLDHDGKTVYVVIGVGGFLGLGQKDVALPYDQVRFTDQPMPGASGSDGRSAGEQGGMMGAGLLGGAMDTGMVGRTSGSADTIDGSNVPPRTTGAGMGTGGGMASNASATGTATGAMTESTGNHGMAGTTNVATVDRVTAYPNHGTISLTADQLKAAPSFQYAR
jgi:hypothetical protein